MKKGQIVNIYEDPITQKVLEGKASLIEKLGDLFGTEMWAVKFENGDIVTRAIKSEAKKS